MLCVTCKNKDVSFNGYLIEYRCKNGVGNKYVFNTDTKEDWELNMLQDCKEYKYEHDE